MKNFKINQTIIRDGYEFRIIEINEFGWVARGKDGQGDVRIFKTKSLGRLYDKTGERRTTFNRSRNYRW